MEKTVAPAQPVGAATSPLDHQSEKDVLTHASGSTQDELKVKNGETTDIQDETAPREVLDEHREQLDGRKKVVIVLALCVGFAFYYYRWLDLFYFLTIFVSGVVSCVCFYLRLIKQLVGVPTFKISRS